MARYFTLRLYFHSHLAHENKLACSWNISPYHTLDSFIKYYNYIVYITDYICKNSQKTLLLNSRWNIYYIQIQYSNCCKGCGGFQGSHTVLNPTFWRSFVFRDTDKYLERLIVMYLYEYSCKALFHSNQFNYLIYN